MTDPARSGCGKKTYLDQATADMALAARLDTSRHRAFHGMTSYLCRRCGLWHHGHDRVSAYQRQQRKRVSKSGAVPLTGKENGEYGEHDDEQ
jgi:hypothetical protein